MVRSLLYSNEFDVEGIITSSSQWEYTEADTYQSSIEIKNADKREAYFIVPTIAKRGETIHIICEVTDNGSPINA